MSNLALFPEPDEGRSDAERALLAGLARLASVLPGLAYVANAYVNLRGHRRELDALVVYRGRAFGIEVDGRHHAKPGRYAADRSRDLLLENGGLLFVRRIVVEDTNRPEDVDAFLHSCVERLRWWGSAA
ncbi:MAG: hypothetical protein M3P93_09060 [Actinomycetota bacterium]|nr:hypothetical protein [Actinomycetota bacterium]